MNKTEEIASFIVNLSCILFLTIVGFILLKIRLSSEQFIIIYFLWICGVITLIKDIILKIRKYQKGSLSDVQIGDNSICFVYSTNKEKVVKKFNFTDIKSFKITVRSNDFFHPVVGGYSGYKYGALAMDIDICVDGALSKISIPFGDTNAIYLLCCAIFDISNKLQNFTYDIKGYNKANIEKALKDYSIKDNSSKM